MDKTSIWMRPAVAVACLVAGLSAFATDYTWSNTETDTKSWQTPGNWSAGGAAATDLPTNAADTATFPAIDLATRTVTLMAEKTWSAGIASVTGGGYWKLVFNQAGSTYGDYVESFGFGNVNGFTGIWSSTGKKTMRLTAASGTQTLTEARVAGRFALEVANAATTADILALSGGTGSLKKSGPGELRVRKVLEPGSLILEIEEGNVTVDGRAADWATREAPTAVLEKSAVWLDASRTDTWQAHAYVDNAGRTRVTNWLDAAGRSIKAEIWDNSGDPVESHIKDIQPPFISSAKSSTGLPLIDFGAGSDSAAKQETYGPQAVMRFTQRFTDAKEFFYVAASTDEGEVFGDDTNYYLSGGGNNVFSFGDQIVANGGFARFNGYERTAPLAWYSAKHDRYVMPRQIDSYTPTQQGSLQMAHVAPGDTTAQQIHYLAGERLYKSDSGGVRIGEVLIFTQTLTAAERQQVTDYLMRKWFAKYSGNDFDVASVADGTSITVPEGATVKIGSLHATGTAFTKKGAGTLQVGRVYPEDMTIAVEGGEVKLDTVVREGTPTAPAGTPYFWADANAANAFTKDGDNVTAWKDCRGNGLKATLLNFPTDITKYPTADTTRVSGKTTLTFPEKSAYAIPTGGGTRETFVACCYTVNPGYRNVIAEGYKTSRRMKVNNVYQFYTFAAPDVGMDIMAGGTCSVDGKPVRPFEWLGPESNPGTLFVKDRWFVAHLTTTASSTALNRLASDGPRNVTGGVSYGEVINYATELTPDERAQVIDYLMTKWLGRRHPEYAEPAGDPSLAFDGDATLSGDVDATFAEVTGNGTLTKKDAGDLTVTKTLTDGFSDLVLRDGSLTIAKPAAPTDDSQFHFDAMDTASYATTYKDADGNTRVSKWADTRANGVTANYIKRYVPSTGNFFNPTNPVLRQVACTDGVTRPMMDFLAYMGRNTEPPTGAALAVSPRPAKTREVHCVMANNPSAADVFGTTDSNTDQFKRGNNGTLFHNNAAADVRNGYLSVNNQPATMSTYVGGADNLLYLVSMSPANGSSYNMGALAHRGSNFTTGLRYGEYIAFAEPLGDKERAWWQGHLLHKWIDGSAPDAVWTNELNSVTLADGATLRVDGGAISAPTLSGGGTIDATKVLGIGTLNLTASDRTTVNALTVAGVADFAGAVTVNLAGGEDLKPGLYALVSAAEFEHLDLSKWTVVGTPAKYKCVIRRIGNDVALEVRRGGMSVVFW